MSEFLWFLVVIMGPIVLGAIIALGVLRQRV
jgi:hypothetical protein